MVNWFLVGAGVDELVEEAFSGPLAPTHAVLAVQDGSVVVERYDDGGERPLRSWSMAKSMLHAVVGLLVGDGRLSLDDASLVPAWAGDERSMITVEHLLAMRDGLAFVEDYVDEGVSDVISMLFGDGRSDVAAFAADRPLSAVPGTRFNYSSGTSNVLSGVVAGIVGRGDEYATFLRSRLFEPLGMTSASPGFDDAGTWVASSYVHATPRDFARFGSLYLDCGGSLLPDGWVAAGVQRRSEDPDSSSGYGLHWWLPPGHSGFEARGYLGQSITVVPSASLVLVRMGETDASLGPVLRAWRAAMVEALST